MRPWFHIPPWGAAHRSVVTRQPRAVTVPHLGGSRLTAFRIAHSTDPYPPPRSPPSVLLRILSVHCGGFRNTLPFLLALQHSNDPDVVCCRLRLPLPWPPSATSPIAFAMVRLCVVLASQPLSTPVAWLYALCPLTAMQDGTTSPWPPHCVITLRKRSSTLTFLFAPLPT